MSTAPQAFYVEGLGFEAEPRLVADDSVAELAEVRPPVKVISQFLRKDGFRLELLAWPEPGVHGVPSHSRNQLGLTHLCVQVDDVEGVVARLETFGGTLIEATRTALPGGLELLVVADPDGNRVELMQL